MIDKAPRVEIAYRDGRKKVMKETRRLCGMKEISNYIGRSECTTLEFIKTLGFPATKLDQAWIAYEDEIDDWWKSQLSDENEIEEYKPKIIRETQPRW